jgi:hypothetical protein
MTESSSLIRKFNISERFSKQNPLEKINCESIFRGFCFVQTCSEDRDPFCSNHNPCSGKLRSIYELSCKKVRKLVVGFVVNMPAFMPLVGTKRHKERFLWVALESWEMNWGVQTYSSRSSKLSEQRLMEAVILLELQQEALGLDQMAARRIYAAWKAGIIANMCACQDPFEGELVLVKGHLY